MNINKKYIIIAVIALIIILILIISKHTKDNFEKRLINILLENGYTKDIGTMYAYDNKEYSIQNCNNIDDDCYGEIYYFDISSYELIKNEMLVLDNVKFDFTPTYDFKTGVISYYYRVNYQNGSLVFKGDYKDETITCDLDYSYGITVDDKNVYCNNLEEKLADFETYSKMLLNNSQIISKMEKGS